VIETIILLLILSISGFAVDGIFFMAVFGIWLKLEALLALILFFSTWISPMIAMFMTLASYIIGHSGYSVLEHALYNESPSAQLFGRVLLAIFPNLESLNIKNYVATDAMVSLGTSSIAFTLAGLYILCILYLAVYIFERKSFDAA
jgi:hypothetical protein